MKALRCKEDIMIDEQNEEISRRDWEKEIYDDCDHEDYLRDLRGRLNDFDNTHMGKFDEKAALPDFCPYCGIKINRLTYEQAQKHINLCCLRCKHR